MKYGSDVCRCGHERNRHSEHSNDRNFTNGRCGDCPGCKYFCMPSPNNPAIIEKTRRGQIGREDKIRLGLLEKSAGPFYPTTDTTKWLISTVRKLAGMP